MSQIYQGRIQPEPYLAEEAERAKDELRDIMTRMVGASIHYTNLGYWMRQPPFGFTGEKINTPNGKRVVLRPDEHRRANSR